MLFSSATRHDRYLLWYPYLYGSLNRFEAGPRSDVHGYVVHGHFILCNATGELSLPSEIVKRAVREDQERPVLVHTQRHYREEQDADPAAATSEPPLAANFSISKKLY